MKLLLSVRADVAGAVLEGDEVVERDWSIEAAAAVAEAMAVAETERGWLCVPS